MPVAGKPMVEWSIAAFRAAEPVRSLVVACPPGHPHEMDDDDLVLVDGGDTRARSVSNALVGVGTELVAIHDAARPLVTSELIEALVADLAADPGAAGVIPATNVTDTIKQASQETRPAFPIQGNGNAGLVVESTLDRRRLWAAQTPQVFRTDALRAALAGDPERVAAATDEAMLVEAAGGRVLIHPTGPENLKVTTPLDLRIAERLLGD